MKKKGGLITMIVVVLIVARWNCSTLIFGAGVGSLSIRRTKDHPWCGAWIGWTGCRDGHRIYGGVSAKDDANMNAAAWAETVLRELDG